MNLPVKLLHDRLDRLEAKIRAKLTAGATEKFARYRLDPAGYARDVLKVQWWSKQVEIAEALLKPPHRVLVKASHSVGKSHLAGGLVNWWYDTRKPGVCLTTAPTARQVRDVLWKEVRRQRLGRGGFPGPKIPRLEDAEDHFAYGFTASTGTSFQGQHERAVLIILDEAVGIDREIWEACDSMVQGVEFGIVAFCNPTDTDSEFYQREAHGGWEVVHIPCVEHPNIAAEIRGEEPPMPSAVRLAWLEERLVEWTMPVTGEPLPTDIEWPPGAGRFLRPGPLAEARLLGRWPSMAGGVWSDALWLTTETPLEIPADALPEIGCDVARFGDDMTEIHVRVGPCSMHHESHNGWGTDETAGRLKQLANFWAEWESNRRGKAFAPFDPKAIRVKVDDDGVGGGVVDQAGGYAFLPVGAGTTADDPEAYPNTRSELWFDLAARARLKRLDFSRLSKDVQTELKRQAMAPRYKLDAVGRRVVEPKAVTKDKLGRSPDSMDAAALAFYSPSAGAVAEWVGRVGDPKTWRDRTGRR